MGDVHPCEPIELIFVDPSRLSRLARDRGVSRAEVIAGQALEEIAERLAAAEAACRAGEFARLAKVARSLVGLSEELGLETVSTVAARVADKAGSGDPVAITALIARLSRAGAHSLAAVGDLAHLRL